MNPITMLIIRKIIIMSMELDTRNITIRREIVKIMFISNKMMVTDTQMSSITT